MEYWLIDVDTGNAQGCYDSLDDALEAIEVEDREQRPTDRLAVLATKTTARHDADDAPAAPRRRAFIQLAVGMSSG